MIQKIYKNTDLLFTISIDDNDSNIINIADVSELNITFYTDTTNVENHIIVNKDDIINDNQILIDNTKLDLLNEGLLKYNIKLRFNNTSIDEPFDIAKTVETEYFIKNNNYVDSTCTGGTVSDTYSKSEIDLKLSLKANSSDVYSKAETNERLAEKANKTDIPNISNLATKDELKLKANTNDVYTKIEIDEKFDNIEEVDLTNYYTKVEVDDKLSAKADTNNVYSKSEVDAKFDDIEPADLSDYYTKAQVDKKIDDAVTGEVDLSAYYKKAEVDSKLSEKADISDIPDTSSFATKTELATKANLSDIPDISAMATKNELSTKANVADVYTKEEVNDLIAGTGGTGTTVDTYTKSQIDTKLASKTDVSRTTTIELDLKKKANSDDVYSKTEVYNKAEVDDLIAGTGGTGGTGTTMAADVLSWKETIASEERAALYNKLLNNIYSKTASFVFLHYLDGNKQYMLNISNILDEGLSKNELKLYGSITSSSSTLSIEVILKKDGSFVINANTNDLYNNEAIEARIAVLESEIKNPTNMTVDCLNYDDK